MESLIALLLVLAVVGFGVWGLTTWVPMDPRFKQLIFGVTAFVLIVWLVALFFGRAPLPTLPTFR